LGTPAPHLSQLGEVLVSQQFGKSFFKFCFGEFHFYFTVNAFGTINKNGSALL
jgi:hypothetical protein